MRFVLRIRLKVTELNACGSQVLKSMSELAVRGLGQRAEHASRVPASAVTSPLPLVFARMRRMNSSLLGFLETIIIS